MRQTPDSDEERARAERPDVDAERQAAYARLQLLRGSEQAAVDVPRRREG